MTTLQGRVSQRIEAPLTLTLSPGVPREREPEQAVSKQAEHQIRERRRQQRAVDDVENPSESRNEPAAVFHFRVPLHETFEQVAQLADPADDHAEDEAFPPEQVLDPRRTNRPDKAGGHDAEKEA